MTERRENNMRKITDENYDDIIDLPHFEPSKIKPPRMPLKSRAAQFSPFEAVRGHKEAIADAEKSMEE